MFPSTYLAFLIGQAFTKQMMFDAILAAILNGSCKLLAICDALPELLDFSSQRSATVK